MIQKKTIESDRINMGKTKLGERNGPVCSKKRMKRKKTAKESLIGLRRPFIWLFLIRNDKDSVQSSDVEKRSDLRFLEGL